MHYPDYKEIRQLVVELDEVLSKALKRNFPYSSRDTVNLVWAKQKIKEIAPLFDLHVEVKH